jgi:uncharacterized membrane-anchored protein YhcB (DUF1043 family)
MDFNYMPKKIARLDLLTGELLKNQNDYYRNRANLIKHFQQISQEEAYNITKNILSERKEKKKLEFALYSTELKTIIAPSIALMQKVGIDYSQLCQELLLKEKFNCNVKEIKIKDSQLKQIIIDTREQNPINFDDYKTINTCLKVGDYCDSEDVANNLTIERKSLNDFISTLSSGYDRFCREIERGMVSNTKIVVLVEYCLSKSVSFNYLPQCRFSQCRPEFIFSRLRDLMQKYTNLQFLFVKGRKESERIVPVLLKNKDTLFGYDLQLLYERRML